MANAFVRQVGNNFQVVIKLSSLSRVIATFHHTAPVPTPVGEKSLAQRRAEDYCSHYNATQDRIFLKSASRSR